MPAPYSFDYAVLRVVPLVEREEFFNAGVILFCPQKAFLQARVFLDRGKLQAFAPGLDPAAIQQRLDAVSRICDGDRNAGPVARLPRSARFHWLVSPRSTIIQVSEVHSGLCHDPEPALERLFREQVLGPSENR